MPQHIVAMGGGGFSMEPDNPLLDQYVLDLTGKARPKVCFMGQASAESYQYQVNFFRAFTKLGAEPSSFSLFLPVSHQWQDELLSQDVIYVGGGNTKSMLALWKDWGVDVVLKQALENGTVLAGISAGAICWFEHCVSDSLLPLVVIPGLGFLKGSACPHYDGEADRRPAVHKMLEDGELPTGIALDDSAAAHFVDGEMHQVVSSVPDAKGYHVSLKDGKAHEMPIDTVYLGKASA